MASFVKFTTVIALSVMAFASVQSNPIVAKSMIANYLQPMCTRFKYEVLDEGRCNGEVIDEIIDHADNIERTPMIREYEEEILELYLYQAAARRLCHPDGTVIRSQCDAMETVCTYGGNIINCRDLTAAPPTAGSQTTAPMTNAPTTAAFTTN